MPSKVSWRCWVPPAPTATQGPGKVQQAALGPATASPKPTLGLLCPGSGWHKGTPLTGHGERHFFSVGSDRCMVHVVGTREAGLSHLPHLRSKSLCCSKPGLRWSKWHSTAIRQDFKHPPLSSKELQSSYFLVLLPQLGLSSSLTVESSSSGLSSHPQLSRSSRSPGQGASTWSHTQAVPKPAACSRVLALAAGLLDGSSGKKNQLKLSKDSNKLLTAHQGISP